MKDFNEQAKAVGDKVRAELPGVWMGMRQRLIMDQAVKAALDAAYAAGLRDGLKDALEIVQEEAEGDIDLADFLIAKRLAHQCSNPQHWDEPHPCKLCAGERLAQQADGGAHGPHEQG